MVFSIGQRVKRKSTGERGRIFAGPSDAQYYDVEFADRDETVPESDLEGLQALDLGPAELLKNSCFGVSEEHDLYLRAMILNHAFQYDSRSGLSNARIEPKLWQLFVMLRVLHKATPRMILADEVGLGKTVEAGLIIKELKARKLADRVLIITPASLVEQWRHELVSKFNESFEIFNSAATEFIGRGRRNAWQERDSIICSLPFALRHKDEILECEWDLVVVDEAHKASRRRNRDGWEAKKTYDFMLDLKSQTQGLLLLTATPMQVHPSQLYSLIDLVEPGLFGSLAQFMDHAELLPRLNNLMHTIQGCTQCTEAERVEALSVHADVLDALGLVAADLVAEASTAPQREELLTRVASLHPLADVMVRNRKREVMDGFTPREPHTHLVEPTALEMELYDEITEYIRQSYNVAIAKKDRAVGFLMVAFQKMLTSSSAAIRVSFEKRVSRLELLLDREQPPRRRSGRLTEDALEELRDAEEASEAIEDLLSADFFDLEQLDFRAAVRDEISSLKGFVRRLEGLQDSKAIRLVGAVKHLLARQSSEKILIFTQFIETQTYLAEMLRGEGFSVEVFNGCMRLEEKEKAVRRFRDRSQILVSTEAGGEGRNFQFCHVMVNYDLPWNPMRVEQRIGRIDRIGQKLPVEIHNLAVVGTLEERVLFVLAERIRMFEESVGSLDPILGEIEREFEQLAMSGRMSSAEAVEAFEVDVERRRREALASEEAQQDLAMDRSSFRRDEANAWLQRAPMADWSDLRSFVADSLEYFGGRISKGSSGLTVVALSPGLRNDMKVAGARYEGEFDPAAALADEPDEFFAIGHEVVDGLLTIAGRRDARQCSAASEAGLDGGPVVEIWYELLSESGRPTGRIVRHRLDQSLEVQSTIVDALPARRTPARNVEAPEWTEMAVQTSRSYLERHDVAAFRDQVERIVEDYQVEELARVKRIHEHTVERYAIERERLEAVIRDLEHHGSEDQKRILPARRGALKKHEQREFDERASYEARVTSLEELAPNHSFRVLATTLVVGP